MFFGLLMGFGLSTVAQEQFTEIPSIISVLTLAVPMVIGMWYLEKWRGLLLVVILGVFALSIETLGIYTGFPYSHFSYQTELGYLLFGTTPWTVFFAWSPLVFASYLLSTYKKHRPLQAFVLFLIILVWSDVVLDPGAVARGLWSYQTDGFWYGVPLQNYLGWIFSGTIAYLIIQFFVAKTRSAHVSVQKAYPYIVFPLFFSTAIWSGVNTGYQQYLPACIGIIGLFVLLKNNSNNYNTPKD